MLCACAAAAVADGLPAAHGRGGAALRSSAALLTRQRAAQVVMLLLNKALILAYPYTFTIVLLQNAVAVSGAPCARCTAAGNCQS